MLVNAPGSCSQFKIHHTIISKILDNILSCLRNSPGIVGDAVYQGKHLEGVVKASLFSCKP